MMKTRPEHSNPHFSVDILHAERLGAIECLDLGLLINAKHEGVVGRVDAGADDVAHLVDKQRIRMGKRLEEIQPPDDEDAA